MRALVSVMPIAGHVAPVTGVVAELRARGHEVVVFTGSRYRDRFEALGAEVETWSAGIDFAELDLTSPHRGPRGVVDVARRVQRHFLDSAAQQAEDLSTLLARHPVDVLAGDLLAIGLGLQAQRLGRPWAGLNLLPLNYPSRDLPPPGFPVPPARGPLGRARDRALRVTYRVVTSGVQRAYNRARSRLGLPPDRQPYGTALFSPWLTLVTGCPGLERPRSDLPSPAHFVGRLAPARPTADDAPVAAAVEPGAASRRPRVVVTQGTHNVDPGDLLLPTLRGLADLDVEVIATSGRPGVSDLGEPVPANARVVDFLDFSSALPLTDVLVTNGGWGGVLEGLAHGVPLVVAGGDIDKPENAARVARSGAGINLRTGRPRPAAVATAVGAVLDDPRYARQAQRLRGELEALGGARTAVDLLERLAAEQAVVHRLADPWGEGTGAG
jgi:UDP:flavonoid glycosyltransferase YjiC (YdhE family)